MVKIFLFVTVWGKHLQSGPYLRTGPRGPGPGSRAINFQGRHIKKIEIEVWYAEKKAVHEREI